MTSTPLWRSVLPRKPLDRIIVALAPLSAVQCGITGDWAAALWAAGATVWALAYWRTRNTLDNLTYAMRRGASRRRAMERQRQMFDAQFSSSLLRESTDGPAR